MMFKVNAERCVRCGKCVKDCPTNTLEMKDGVPSVRGGKGGCCIRTLPDFLKGADVFR